jgi:transposase
MMDWAKAPQGRDQLVLFPTRLDDILAADHHVRLLEEVLSQLDWSPWEAAYDLRRGQPPIHPKVLASVILYGVLTGIRTSRALEEALHVRVDFRWLAEGRSIDHTTLSEFRRKKGAALKNLFVQIGLVARQLGWLSLETLAFDGTRMRANNRRRGSQTPDQLRKLKEELAAKFADLEAKTAALDARDEEVFGEQSSHQLEEELADVKRRRRRVDAALAEIERIEQSGGQAPKRVPMTDPQSRITPNKEGGFAPNYTPLATVDVDSGLIVSAGVIPGTDEDKHLIAELENVQEQFGLKTIPGEVLADGMMATGENLAECASRGISIYAPLPGSCDAENPAVRDDPSQPVAEEDRHRLPTKTKTYKGQKGPQLEKQAFVYDQGKDCYWCPLGKQLPYANTTSETSHGRRVVRRRYKSSREDCVECPLRSICLRGKAKQRTISREQHEAHREAHQAKMATAEAQEQYARRRHPAERPFATIKHQFGFRTFLLRGVEKVALEWLWLSAAFNLHRLFGLIRSGVDPPQPAPS